MSDVHCMVIGGQSGLECVVHVVLPPIQHHLCLTLWITHEIFASVVLNLLLLCVNEVCE